MSSSISSSESLPERAAATEAARRTGGSRRFLGAFAITALLSLAVAWVFTARFQDGFLDPEFGMWRAKEHLVATCDLGDTLILGDSRAVAGFVPAELGDATNLALGGASPIEMYFMAERALRCPNAPRRVILSFSPPLLIDDTNYYWPRTALFGFLSDAQMDAVRRTARAVGDTSLYPAPNVGDLDARLTDWLYAHHFPSYAVSSVVNARGFGRLAENHRFYDEVLRTRGHHLYGTNSGFDVPADEAFLTRFKPSPLTDVYMRRLIAALAARGAEVLYIPAPLNEATTSRMDPAVVRQISAYLDGLQARFANFRLIGPAVVSYPDKLFGDAHHLNAQGARLFSAGVAAELAALPVSPAAHPGG